MKHRVESSISCYVATAAITVLLKEGYGINSSASSEIENKQRFCLSWFEVRINSSGFVGSIY